MPNPTETYSLFLNIQNRIQWIQRYLFELDSLSPQPIPKFNERLGQSGITVAPQFFAMVTLLLFDAAWLSVACLLDPELQGVYQNASMEKAILSCSWLTKEQQTEKLEQLAKLKCSPECIKLLRGRNKLLAHVDYETFITNPASARNYLLSRDDISRMVVQLTSILDAIRPSGVPGWTYPREEKSWQGCTTVLRMLASDQRID
jgi:hypothetical protein